MKIGIVSPEFPPERGGIQTYAWEYARELALRGHEVAVFTQPHPQGEMTNAGFQIAPVLRLRRRFDRRVFARDSADVWHAMNAAYAWLALEHSRVFVTVHGNDFLQPYFPLARLDLRERLHLPFGSAADRWIGDWLTNRLARRALPRAAHIFTNSKFTERRLCDEIDECRGRTSAAMAGVSADYFSRRRPPRREGPMRLVTVCRLAERHKNVDLVLRALARVGSAHAFHYTVIGDGELRRELEQLANDLGLAPRVTFTGFLDQARLHEQLLDSDLFILPTSATPTAYEGFGIVYLEANACGCPVLAARIGGAVEAVEEGVSGGLIDAVTVESIADAVTRFLNGEIRFDAAACIAFARKFSWARVADHCLGWYERSLAART